MRSVTRSLFWFASQSNQRRRRRRRRREKDVERTLLAPEASERRPLSEELWAKVRRAHQKCRPRAQNDERTNERTNETRTSGKQKQKCPIRLMATWAANARDSRTANTLTHSLTRFAPTCFSRCQHTHTNKYLAPQLVSISSKTFTLTQQKLAAVTDTHSDSMLLSYTKVDVFLSKTQTQHRRLKLWLRKVVVVVVLFDLLAWDDYRRVQKIGFFSSSFSLAFYLSLSGEEKKKLFLLQFFISRFSSSSWSAFMLLRVISTQKANTSLAKMSNHTLFGSSNSIKSKTVKRERKKFALEKRKTILWFNLVVLCQWMN